MSLYLYEQHMKTCSGHLIKPTSWPTRVIQRTGLLSSSLDVSLKLMTL